MIYRCPKCEEVAFAVDDFLTCHCYERRISRRAVLKVLLVVFAVALAWRAFSAVPQPPSVIQVSPPAATTYSLPPLVWSNDSRVVRSALVYGQANWSALKDVTGSQAIVTGLTNGRWWFAVIGYDTNGQIVQTSQPLEVTLPPTVILDFCFKLDGREIVLMSFTNQPPGKVGMFYSKQWKSYEP